MSGSKLLADASAFRKRGGHQFIPTLDEASDKVLLTGVSTVAPNGSTFNNDRAILEELQLKGVQTALFAFGIFRHIIGIDAYCSQY